MKYLPFACFCVFYILTVIVCMLSLHEMQRYEIVRSSMKQVKTTIKLPKPVPSQESVEIARAIYTIDVHYKNLYTNYNKDLTDRGVIHRSLGDNYMKIEIGPTAFDSWAVLGSTIGHESEVHSFQPLYFALALNIFSILVNEPYDWGLVFFERAAYQYEMEQQDRYSLTDKEVIEVNDTMNLYYPNICGTSIYCNFLALMFKQ